MPRFIYLHPEGIGLAKAFTAMSDTLLDRYNDFQEEAVGCILRDYKGQPGGRFLLVIPTGGGKTFTAVKAVNRLFSEKVLEAPSDVVLWVAHRTELVKQAGDTFAAFEAQHPELSFRAQVKIIMVSQLDDLLKTATNVRLVVIDEAHHAAAQSYRSAFGVRGVGVLGLTATPSRHDGAPLEFERESYSIGFPDLVRRGIVLKPQVVSVAGGTYSFSFEDQDGLKQLDNAARNQSIIAALTAGVHQYRKVIIFAPTVDSVRNLHKAILASPLQERYPAIDWITGEGNSRGMERGAFIALCKAAKRSIVINVDVLTEGYDDPTVNTVVMAAPTRSKLYYMQAMGRAIRHDPHDESKEAFIIEVVDVLPNIQYRIDNRWLYADISDALEPAVIDVTYANEQSFQESLEKLWHEYQVAAGDRINPPFDPDERYSILLFKSYAGPNQYRHLPVVLNRSNRLRFSNAFNYLSARVWAKTAPQNSKAALRQADPDPAVLFGGENRAQLIFEAMKNSAAIGDYEAAGMPWITFVALQQKNEILSSDLKDFIATMVNRTHVLQTIETHAYVAGDFLLRLPLPLGGNIGLAVSGLVFAEFQAFIKKLGEFRVQVAESDYYYPLQQVLDDHTFPLPGRYLPSALLICRESLDYFRKLP